jgi:hypothetical protein
MCVSTVSTTTVSGACSCGSTPNATAARELTPWQHLSVRAGKLTCVRWTLVIRVAIVILTTTTLQACGNDDVRKVARTANEVRHSEAGRLAQKACRRAGELIPQARVVFDRASEEALQGDRNHAKEILASGLRIHALQLELQARAALAACRAALG